MTAQDIIQKYISFFEKRGHKRISNASLVPENDPTTLFTSSGMQPFVPYLLGEPHPQGKRLMNVQNCFRAQDVDEVGDNRHITFFRMLGNWSLGDYFKKEQLPWFFEFLTQELKLDPNRLYATVFGGEDKFKVIENKKWQPLRPDVEAADIWTRIFEEIGIKAKIANVSTRDKPDINKCRIFYYGADKNWWSRSGTPEQMPIGEIGGQDSEVFYDFGEELNLHNKSSFKNEPCHPNCQCGRFLEIGNSVFMQYKKTDDSTFEELPNKNVDFGAGLERLVAATEDEQDMFETTLLKPIVRTIELSTERKYKEHSKNIRIIIDHLIASVFIVNAGIVPSNKEQGYILRRLIRRGFDNYYTLRISRHSDLARSSPHPNPLPKGEGRGEGEQARMTIGNDIALILESIVEQYKKTDPDLLSHYENIKNTILEEKNAYETTLKKAKDYIFKKYQTVGDELKGKVEISANDAFFLYSSHGLSPTQIKNLGYVFNEQQFAKKMEMHQNVSRAGALKKFAGGLADHKEKTIMGHTATHLMHQAIRDVLGNHVHQTGSNITSERVRFDFNYEKKITDEQLNKVKEIVNEKIRENLRVYFEIMPLKKAKTIGAIGLFDEKYQDKVKVYFIGGSTSSPQNAYSKEFCGGPHVDFTKKLKKFKIVKQENLGRGQKRLYAIVGVE